MLRVTSLPYDVLLWSTSGTKTLGYVFLVLRNRIRASLGVPSGLYFVSGNLCEEIRRTLCYLQQSGTNP